MTERPMAGEGGDIVVAPSARTEKSGSIDTARLRAWLHDPPGVKPGSKMPNLGLSSAEITNLIAYLQTLK